MVGEIRIDFDQLARHSGRVGQIAASIDMAKSAASSTDLSGAAFGIMCSFLVPAVNGAANRARTSIGQAAKALDRASRSVTVVRKNYEAAEQNAIDIVKDLDNELSVLGLRGAR